MTRFTTSQFETYLNARLNTLSTQPPILGNDALAAQVLGRKDAIKWLLTLASMPARSILILRINSKCGELGYSVNKDYSTILEESVDANRSYGTCLELLSVKTDIVDDDVIA